MDHPIIKNIRTTLWIVLLGFFCLQLNAQELGFGFRAGWSFSSFRGPLLNGETNNYQSGIHIGPTLALKMTDKFGFRSGFIYSQAGTDYSFKNLGYMVFINEDSRKIVMGNVDKKLIIDNTYIDIPLGAYFHVTDHIQIFGGFNLGFLVSSTAKGSLDFEFVNQQLDSYKTKLDYRYYGDEVGESSGGTAYGPVRIGGQTYEIPEFLGAYYYYENKTGSVFNVLDVGVHAGVSYFLNSALYLSVRGYYGLTDVSNNEMDLSPVLNPDNLNQLQFDADKDQNISLQISLGFSF